MRVTLQCVRKLLGLLAVALPLLAYPAALLGAYGSVPIGSTTIGDSAITDIAVAGSGNSYVTGHFSGDAIFGAGEANQTTLTAAGRDDIFVAKYNPIGILLWAKRAGGTDNDWAAAIAVDGSGNSYVTGHFYGAEATFGLGEANQTTVTGHFLFDATMFIAKYNPSGALEWVKRGGSTSSGRASVGVQSRAIAVDILGNSYITGTFSLSAIFGEGEANVTVLTSPSLIPSANFRDVFIAKYNSSGAFQWAKSAGGNSGNDEGNAIAVDGSGNGYVRGTYAGPATFGAGEANETTLMSSFGLTGFVAKYNTNGVLQWAKKTGAAGAGPVDLDGDGKSDIGIYRNGAWAIRRSADGAISVVAFGNAASTPVPADFDGDGKSDLAIYKDGAWSWIRSSDGGNASLGWGGPEWEPVAADYDGDGKADIAVYNPSMGFWSIVRSSDGETDLVNFGGPGWIAVPADFDGDGRADVAVYKDGVWSILRSSDGGNTVVGHGGSAFEPVPADYDGDGKADIAVHAGGAWSILNSSNNSITVILHGGPGWVAVPSDYDGDGKSDIAVYHPMGAWSIVESSTNTIRVVGHGGGPTDVPLN